MPLTTKKILCHKIVHGKKIIFEQKQSFAAISRRKAAIVNRARRYDLKYPVNIHNVLKQNISSMMERAGPGLPDF